MLNTPRSGVTVEGIEPGSCRTNGVICPCTLLCKMWLESMWLRKLVPCGFPAFSAN